MTTPKKFIQLIVFLFSICTINAQIEKQEKTMVIDSIAKLVKKYYVSLDEGEKMANVILQKNASGGYDSITNPHRLANQLTADLRSVNGDLHMSVHHKKISKQTKTKEPSTYIDKKGIWSNYGFQEMNVLDGNIGYLKISHFTNWKNFKATKKVITSSINSLKNTDALIIDVRNNTGGVEDVVAYLISYFYDGDSIHLSDYYYRYADKRYGVYTTVDIPGTKLPSIPLYVLVNSRTASAGESLAYMLKHLGRATIIGETTAGAGNGAMSHRVSDQFEVTISSETTINAITKTSFEKTGVIPNIKTESDYSLTKGYQLALEYLKKHKSNIDSSNYDKLIDFLPKKKKTDIVNLESYQKYVGRYKGPATEIIISLKGANLSASMVGRGGQFKLIPRGNHTFIVEGVKERIQFVFNKKEEVMKLIGIDSPMDLKKIE